MKYLPLQELEIVTNALNFETNTQRVVGGCDLYTTKAAGQDKKLYKDINSALESQYESNVRFSKSLSPPQAELFNNVVTRASPFGPLNQVSSRRTFAYMIATMNASHPDYDFSQILRPSDYSREKSLKGVMGAVDETLFNLRPRPTSVYFSGPSSWVSNGALNGAQTPGGTQVWGPRAWRAIDKEMTLRECEVYSYAPESDPLDGEDCALWSMKYFFFNKDRKRVLYLHLRGLSIASHSPTTPMTTKSKRPRPISQSLSNEAMGAKKRAKYWLGDKADYFEDYGWDDTIYEPGDDEVDADDALGASDVSSFGLVDDEDDEIETMMREKSKIAGVSEHIAETMEV